MRELTGKVAVVTGGASGIGRALAARIAAERPAGIAIADLDGEGAQSAAAAALAASTPALGRRCDVGDEAQLRQLLRAAHDAFGPVDVFFANAGVAIGADEQTPDDVWDRALDVNLRAHVLAARALVPEWLQRGSGCFVATASAAGLLTQIGCAPYAVSKHAAVAFAEWLAVTYGDRGIHVSCLCPMGVDTPMVRPPARGPAAQVAPTMAAAAIESVLRAGEVLSPQAVADAVIDALTEERFLVLPHPEVLEFWRHKSADYDRWLAGMQRMRRAVSA